VTLESSKCRFESSNVTLAALLQAGMVVYACGCGGMITVFWRSIRGPPGRPLVR
jgi:hypothetical protein